MRCNGVRRKLGAYEDGELGPGARADVDRHLESCEGCREALARLRSVGSLLEGAQLPPVPEGFASRVMTEARRRATEGGPTRRAGRLPLRRWWPLTAPMQAAAVLVFAVGLTLGALMGWATWQGRASESRPATVAEADPLEIYSADCLTDAPEGSLTEAYMSMLTSPAGEE